MGMQDTVAIIGAGSIIELYYIPHLKRLGYHSFLIHDLNQERAAYVSGLCNGKTASLDECKKNANVFIVAVPPGTKNEILKGIISPGKMIICEKPFVHSQKEAEELSEIAAQENCTLLVAHIRRLFGAIDLAHKHLAGNPYGRLLKAELFEGMRFNYKTQSGYVTSAPLGGVLLDTGSHVLDAFLFTTGMDTSKEFFCKVITLEKDKGEPSHENHFSILINNIPVNLKLSRYAPLSNKMNLFFEHATVEVPLLLSPNIRINLNNGHSFVLSAADSCISYMNEAFKQQLELMLLTKAYELFDARKFLHLSTLLEKLIHA